MRTTITLDPDVEALVKRVMRDRGVSFKEAVNEAIRTGATRGRPRRAFRTKVRSMGVPRIDLTKALMLAGALEDEATIRELAAGR